MIGFSVFLCKEKIAIIKRKREKGHVNLSSSTLEGKKKTVIQITIFEGRNRQVRRMMEYFHCEVTRLSRIQYGFLDLGHLRQGQYRKLRSFEIRKLMHMSDQDTSGSM